MIYIGKVYSVPRGERSLEILREALGRQGYCVSDFNQAKSGHAITSRNEGEKGGRGFYDLSDDTIRTSNLPKLDRILAELDL